MIIVNRIPTTGPLQPQDVRQITVPQLDGFTVAGRLAVILGDETDGMVSAMLADLATPLPRAADDAVAQGITRALLDEINDHEAATRRLRKRIEKLDARRVSLHERAQEMDVKERRRAEAAEAERQAEAAAAQALAERVARVTEFAAAEGMRAEHFRDFDAVHKYRLLTDNAGHRLLPHRFDNPTEFHSLIGTVRGGVRWVVLPESVGSIAHLERWLAHHCHYEP